MATVTQVEDKNGNIFDIEDEAAQTKIGDLSNLETESKTNLVSALNETKDQIEDKYSTTETKTNKKWIDGKPIYRKVYNLTAPSNANTNSSIGALPTNIETATFCFAIVNASQETPLYSMYPAPSPKMTGIEDEYFCYWLLFETGAIRARVGSSFIGLPVTLTLEYTKTTD